MSNIKTVTFPDKSVRDTMEFGIPWLKGKQKKREKRNLWIFYPKTVKNNGARSFFLRIIYAGAYRRIVLAGSRPGCFLGEEREHGRS